MIGLTFAESIGSRCNRYWRIVGTGASFSLFGLGAATIALLLVVLVFPFPVSRARKQRYTRKTISRACWFYVRCMRFMGLLSFEFSGTEQLAAPGQLVIANHPSLLDVIFLLSVMPDTNCIVKAGLWQNPFTFGVVSLAGYLRNDSDHLMDEAVNCLINGERLIVFPEATRTSGNTIVFKRGAANLAVLSKCPLTPVLIDCYPPTLQKNEPWYKVPNSPPHFELKIQPTIDVSRCIDTSRPRSIQVRHLTKYLLRYYQLQLEEIIAGSHHQA